MEGDEPVSGDTLWSGAQIIIYGYWGYKKTDDQLEADYSRLGELHDVSMVKG